MKRCLILLAACGTSDPCDDVTDACVTLHVSSPTISKVDQLEIDLLWGARHETTTTQNAATTTELPLVTAITLDPGDPGDPGEPGEPGAATSLGVVVAGKLSGTVLGTAAATASLPRGAIELVLVTPIACIAGARYCGGDKVAGDPATLYECNGVACRTRSWRARTAARSRSTPTTAAHPSSSRSSPSA